MTEIPAHLLARARAARERSAGGGDGPPNTTTSSPSRDVLQTRLQQCIDKLAIVRLELHRTQNNMSQTAIIESNLNIEIEEIIDALTEPDS